MQVCDIFNTDVHQQCLWRLKSLTLTDLGIDWFSVTLCFSMGQLTHLNLSGNHLNRIPPALSQLAALRELLLCQNPELHLTLKDVEIVGRLGKLERLDLSKKVYGNPPLRKEEEMAFVWALSKRMPDLECIFG